MKRIILSTAIIGLLFSSCKKEDELVSRKDVLTTGQWRITAHSTTFYINGVYQAEDFYADYLECEKAALITFPKQDDAYIKYTPGAVACDPASVSSGRYPFYPAFRLVDNSSVLRYYDVQGNAHDFTIDYMDKDVLKTTSRQSSTANGATFSEEIILNYKHVN